MTFTHSGVAGTTPVSYNPVTGKVSIAGKTLNSNDKFRIVGQSLYAVQI
jgi:hypothetical protein